MIRKLIPLTVLALVGCAGMSFNPKGTMCIGDGFSIEQTQDIIDAAQEWHDKTSGEVDFQIRRGNGCDVDVIPVPHLRYGDKTLALGITDASGKWIKFNVQDVYHGNDISHYSLRETALHEMGHYLTGGNHSPNRADIMFARGILHIAQDGTVGMDRHLTEDDVSRWTGKSNHSYHAGKDPYPAETPDDIPLD